MWPIARYLLKALTEHSETAVSIWQLANGPVQYGEDGCSMA